MTDDPYTYFNSDEASGFSVDDIVPPAPELFTVEYRPDTHLSWQAAAAPDLAWYNIYRGDTAEFVPSEANRVAQVSGDVMPRGRHEVVWRGRDEGGRQLAWGMYLYRMQAGGVVETRRMALIK